jgi:hypothetical protein
MTVIRLTGAHMNRRCSSIGLHSFQGIWVRYLSISSVIEVHAVSGITRGLSEAILARTRLTRGLLVTEPFERPEAMAGLASLGILRGLTTYLPCIAVSIFSSMALVASRARRISLLALSLAS